jgi:hypothetical protein
MLFFPFFEHLLLFVDQASPVEILLGSLAFVRERWPVWTLAQWPVLLAWGFAAALESGWSRLPLLTLDPPGIHLQLMVGRALPATLLFLAFQYRLELVERLWRPTGLERR